MADDSKAKAQTTQQPATAQPDAPAASKLIPVAIDREMHRSYIDYAMSVIVGRALPDVRDGFKPVHRRVIYGMYEAGMTAGKPYKKSARIVGDVMGKYHPHGDSAIYDTLVRMAQDFSLRYPLVDGQGNFGSIDGDAPAAMRYTESRLKRIAEDMVADIEKDTVDFRPNYDESLQEPDVLPAKLPNLLVNGSTGIAVGMATNIPPHNLAEVVDATVMCIDNPHATIQELMEVMPGPDFPTGGMILGQGGVYEAFSTGRGHIKVRARTHLEDDDTRIIVTEIPYMVNKSNLIEQIAELVKDKRIEGISDLRDESDREGMRFIVELKRDALPDVVLNQLFAHTQLETTFSVINLALVDGAPRVLTLLETIHEYIKHRKIVVTRRTRFELEKAQERSHILEGLLIALDNIDRIIAIIRGSASPDEAKSGLMGSFKLSEPQCAAILDMRLQRLTGLERQKIKDEHATLQLAIENYRRILASPSEVLKIIRAELLELKEKYGDERRTEINREFVDMDIEDLIPREDIVITVTNTGYIKRIAMREYHSQNRGGKGLVGMKTKDEDYVVDLFITNSHDYILLFTNLGRVYWLKGYKVPSGGRHFKGKPLVNLIPKLEEAEKVQTLLPVREFDDKHFLVFATRNGIVKKTELSAFSRPRSSGIIALQLEEGDELISAMISSGEQEIILATERGLANRFDEHEVRPMGRNAYGVIGMRLEEGDHVVSMAVVDCTAVEGADAESCELPSEEDVDELLDTEEAASDDEEDIFESVFGPVLLTVTQNGYGKRSPVCQYRRTHRGSRGVRNIICDDRNGPVVAALTVEDSNELLLSSQEGMIIRVPVDGIRVIGRSTKGVRIMNLDGEDKVVAVARYWGGEDAVPGAGAGGPDDQDGQSGDDPVSDGGSEQA